MVAAVSEVLPLPERSLNNWHEGVWASVCVRAPVWCVRGRGWGEGTKPNGVILFLFFICLFICCSPPHPPHPPSRVQKPMRGQPTPDSTLPPPGRWGQGMDVKVAVPTVELRGEPDLEWPLLLNLCPARCYVPTYFTSVKN